MSRIKKPYFEYWSDFSHKETLNLILAGHLVIENLLVEAIKTQFRIPAEFDPYEISYPKKVELCVSLGILPPDKKGVYLKLNNIRNKFAHKLDYDITFNEAFQYAKEMDKAGFSFSDKTIHNDKKLSQEWYGTFGILIEILNHLAIELIVFLHDYGVQIPL